MNDDLTPEPVPSLASMNGILPGIGWPTDLLSDDRSFETFFSEFIFPFDDDPLLRSIISQAHAEWHALFPDSDERDRLMFMAGVLTAQYWWAANSIETRNAAMEAGDLESWDDQILVPLDVVDMTIAQYTARIVSTVHYIDEDEDLEEAFADIIEGLDK